LFKSIDARARHSPSSERRRFRKAAREKTTRIRDASSNERGRPERRRVPWWYRDVISGDGCARR
jgi:hypothetical protein